MLRYDKDIYKRIMKPVGLDIWVTPGVEYGIRNFSPKNQKEYWDFLYSRELAQVMGISRAETFSSISKGKFDKKYVSVTAMDNLKLSLKGKNSYLKSIYNHLNQVLEDCATVEMLYSLEKRSKNSLTISREKLDRFHELYKEEIAEKRDGIIQALSVLLESMRTEILRDRRFKGDIVDLIERLIEEEPIRLIGLLCVFALFPEDESDTEFVGDLCAQYCNGVDLGMTYIRKEETRSHDLTSFINATTDTVLFRDDEYKEIIEIINHNKGIVLSGFGGTGKTSIARLLFSELKSEFDYCGWINYNGDLKSSMIADIELDDYSDETMTENDIQKKWKYIVKMLANNKKSKIFVIDNVDYIEGVQSPITDEELAAFSGWDNIKVIITSRLAKITGYDNVKTIKNLGDGKDCKNCIELFYHYNPEALAYRKTNETVVKKLCELAGYNTMAIELLAKGSRYEADALENYLENLMHIGFKYADDVPVETNHDFNHIEVVNDDGSIERHYYDRGRETAASQLMKLFNMKQRSLVERQILWDFHCLPEAERVSKAELKEWLGYTFMEIDRLKEESWIKYEDGFFYMHPLVNQAVSCTEEEWDKYWDFAESRRLVEKSPSLVTKIKNHTLFSPDDGFVLGIRKIFFADYLSYEGRYLEPQELLYIADYARKRGVRALGRKYYKISYNKLYQTACDMGCLAEQGEMEKLTDKQLDVAKQFFKSTYYYGYMLSYTKSGYDDAEVCLALATKVMQNLRKQLSKEEGYELQGMSFDHYGYVKSNNHKNMLNNFVNACMLYRLAISYRKKLVEMYPDNLSYQRDLAWSLDNLGALFAMADYKKLIGNKGSDKDLCIAGTGALFSYDEEYEFFMSSEGKAEGYLMEALKMRTEIAAVRGDEASTEVAWTCCNIASLLSKYPSRYEDAEKQIEAALVIYKKLEEEFPEQHSSSLARTYTAYGRLLANWDGRKKDAIAAYEKALEINRTMEHDYPGIYIKEIEAIKIELNALH